MCLVLWPRCSARMPRVIRNRNRPRMFYLLVLSSHTAMNSLVFFISCLVVFAASLVSAGQCWNTQERQLCCPWAYYKCCKAYSGALWWRKCTRYENMCGDCDGTYQRNCCSQQKWTTECLGYKQLSSAQCSSTWSYARAEEEAPTSNSGNLGLLLFSTLAIHIRKNKQKTYITILVVAIIVAPVIVAVVIVAALVGTLVYLRLRRAAATESTVEFTKM